MPTPVTVSITRHVEPVHTEQVLAWTQAGFALAERFPGFLGAGWVRTSPESGEWHFLYRFASAEALAVWEASPQRQWWLGAASGLVGELRRERRTGIEGWFDEPSESDVEDLRPGPVTPPRWKQAVMIWMAFFPLSLVVGALLTALGPPLPTVWRVLVTTLVMTPVMTYLVLPQLTRRLAWWLQGRPAPWSGKVRH